MLTLAITCDICRSEIARQNNSIFVPNTLTVLGKHVCDTCAEKVREFLKGIK